MTLAQTVASRASVTVNVAASMGKMGGGVTIMNTKCPWSAKDILLVKRTHFQRASYLALNGKGSFVLKKSRRVLFWTIFVIKMLLIFKYLLYWPALFIFSCVLKILNYAFSFFN